MDQRGTVRRYVNEVHPAIAAQEQSQPVSPGRRSESENGDGQQQDREKGMRGAMRGLAVVADIYSE